MIFWLPFLNLFVLGFNDMSTLVGLFVSSPREMEKRDRRDNRGDSRGDEREGQGRKENEWQWRNRRNKNIPPLPLPAARIVGLAQLWANISWMPWWHKIHNTFAKPNHPQGCLNYTVFVVYWMFNVKAKLTGLFGSSTSTTYLYLEKT